MRTEHELLLQNDTPTPLGRLKLAGRIRNGTGVFPPYPLRVYGSYALVCVLKGQGTYRDIHHASRPVTSGDVILVFPELPHAYGPPENRFWDEMYVTFDGPVFDLWRHTGLLHLGSPVLPSPSPDFATNVLGCIEGFARASTPARRVTALCEFLTLFSRLLAPHTPAASRVSEKPDKIAMALALLDTELGTEIDVSSIAERVGMPYETFRKRFQKQTGQSPAQYRTRRRMEAACELLRYSPQMTNRQVAETLGFADEFHFSRRFRQVMGITPSVFRTTGRGLSNEPEDWRNYEL